MTSANPIAWQFQPGLDAVALALAMLAVHLTADLSRRVGSTRGCVATLWLCGGALAFGTGMAAVHFVSLGGHPLPFPINYGGRWTVLAGLVVIATAALFLVIASRP